MLPGEEAPGGAPGLARPGSTFTPRDLGHEEPPPLALRPYCLLVPVCDFSKLEQFGGLARPPRKEVRTCSCTCAFAPRIGKNPSESLGAEHRDQ